jgi:hypothetical protein
MAVIAGASRRASRRPVRQDGVEIMRLAADASGASCSGTASGATTGATIEPALGTGAAIR